MKEYTYMPEVRRAFRCTVPDEKIRQVFLVDGILQEDENEKNGVTLKRGPDDKGLRLHIKGDHFGETIQIISVRSENLSRPLEFTNEWTLEPESGIQIIVCDHTLKEHLYRTSVFLRSLLEKTPVLISCSCRMNTFVPGTGWILWQPWIRELPWIVTY